MSESIDDSAENESPLQTPESLKQARDRFAELLKKDTSELDWQRFFTQCPYVISESLPLRLQPGDIIPKGRPGISEPDFIFYPQRQLSPYPYGVIELKRPSSTILNTPRKNVLTLASDVHTALAQGVLYADQLERDLIMRMDQVAILGSERHIFVILGMSSEIARKVTNELLKKQFERLMPAGMRLIPYDSLFRLFSERIPPLIQFAIPLTPSCSTTDILGKQKISPILFEISGYRFQSAETKEDMDRIRKIRHQVYNELGIEVEKNGTPCNDEYDGYAVHLIGIDSKDVTVAAMRAIPNNPLGFPLERDFPLSEYMRKNGITHAIECGRFVMSEHVDLEYRSEVAFGLFKCLWEYCEKMGIHDVFTTTQMKVLKRYSLPYFKQIGEGFISSDMIGGVGTVWAPVHCNIRSTYESYLKL